MSQFSIQNLFSVPQVTNERLLPTFEGDRVITFLQALDYVAIEHLKLLGDAPQDQKIDQSKLFEIRTAWYDKPEVIDVFIEKYKDSLRPEDIELVSTWKSPVRGKFICAKYFAEYAAFYSLEHEVFFGVSAITQDFEDMVKMKPPFVLATTLLPHKDRIIWDGLVMVGDVSFTKANTIQLMDLCKLARRENKIIRQLPPQMSE